MATTMELKEKKRLEQAKSDTRWFTNPERELKRFRILMERMKRVYLQDSNDWIVAYSSGKDSSLTLDLVFRMLETLTPEERHKTVHVVAADTQVETPQMVAFLRKNLKLIEDKGRDLNIKVHYVVPSMKENYWYNIIGKGNTAPSPESPFQWCTMKLKISPMNKKLKEILSLQHTGIFGDNAPYDATLLLGVRNSESTKRKRSIKKHSLERFFAKHSDFEEIRVFHPIKYINDADLWNYIHFTRELAWGLPSSELWAMYSDGEECPIVRTTSDKACGASNSRNGCWTCLYSPREDPMLETLIKAGNENIRYLSDWKKFLYDVKFDVRYREPLRRTKYKEHANYTKVEDIFSLNNFYYEHYQRAEKGEKGIYKPGSYSIELRKKLLEKLLYAQDKSGYLLITEDEFNAVLDCWAEDGYHINKHDIQPVNHQHDGAVVLKPDWTVRGKDSFNPRPNPNPLFYVPIEFQYEGKVLVSFVQERQRVTGKSIFCYFDYEEHNNIKLVYNKLVFIVCEQGIETEEQAKSKVMNFLFLEGAKETEGIDGKPYPKMQGRSFEASLQHILLDSLKPAINNLSDKKEDLIDLDDKQARNVYFIHKILGNIKEEIKEESKPKKIHQLEKQMALF